MTEWTRRTLLATGAASLIGAHLAGPARAQTTPRRGGVLTGTIGFLEPQAIFVPAGGGGSPTFTATKVLEPLVQQKADQSFIGVLATAWEPSKDFKSYKLTLRRDVLWHDGKPFTAEDVAFSITAYWKTLLSGGILKELTGVQVLDSHTVVVEFARPIPQFSFLSTLDTNLIIPKHIYDTGNIALNPANNAPIGTGPWKFKRWVRGSHAEFDPNEKYWIPGQPYLDGLIVRWWREPSGRAAALETGELDIAVGNPISLGDLTRLRDTGKVNLTFDGYVGLSPTGVHFNVRRPILKDRAVRQALLHAIDRKFIADTIYFGVAQPAVSTISTNNANYFNPDVPHYAFDPAKAATLLDAAGYPVKNGKRFEVKLVATGWSEENPKAGAYLKQVFEDLKIDVKLVVPDRPNSLKALYTDYDFDIAYSQGGGSSTEPVPTLTYLFTTDGIAKGIPFRNATGFGTPELDALVDKITFEVDPKQRAALLHQFAQITGTEVPVVPLIELKSYTVARKAVRFPTDSSNYAADRWNDVWLAN